MQEKYAIKIVTFQYKCPFLPPPTQKKPVLLSGDGFCFARVAPNYEKKGSY